MSTKFIDDKLAVNFSYYEDKAGNGDIYVSQNSFCGDFILKNNDDTAYQGFFSGCENVEGKVTYYRDPHGFSKLYLGKTSQGDVVSSRSWIKLARYGVDFKTIRSIPPGVVLEEHDGTFKEIRHLKSLKSNLKKEEIGAELIRRIDLFFEKFFHWKNSTADVKNLNVNLALSGGLDSSTLLTRALRYGNIVSHTLELPGSKDSELALTIAEKCASNVECHSVDKQQIVDVLKQAPILSEDWRDFNVHCGALNMLLAQAIRNNQVKPGFIVTGDLMNEFVCDYHEENLNGKKYYRLPDISKKSLQRWLVRGLMTSSREDRVFENYGLTIIQPYAITYDLYSCLKEEDLSIPDIKRICNTTKDTKWLLKLISDVKLRAQVGSKDTMGILGVAVECGYNDDRFLAIISEYCNVEIHECKDLIFGGSFPILEV